MVYLNVGRWFRGIIIGTSIGVLGAALALTPLQFPLETSIGLYTFFHLRGERPPPPEVAIVAIDGRTGDKLGLPPLPRDWPRSMHGKLVDELTRRGAAVIVFDFDFRRTRGEQQDAIFAKSIASSNRVVLFEYLNGRHQPIEDEDGRILGSVWIDELDPPRPVLVNATRALAPFPLPKIDASVHQYWTFQPNAHDAPTMPAAALQLYALQGYEPWRELLAASTQLPLDKLPIKAADVRDARHMKALMRETRRLFKEDTELATRIALLVKDPSADSSSNITAALVGLYSGNADHYLDFYGPAGTIPSISYQSVIKGSEQKATQTTADLAGKVIFVGYSDLFDPSHPDRFFTVFARDDGIDLAGVEIAATAFGNLLETRSVNPLDASHALLALLMFGVVMGAVVYLTPAVYGVAIAVILAGIYYGFAQYSFNTMALWWPLAIPMLVQLPLALFIGLVAQYRLERRRVEHISDAIRYYVPENVSRALTGMDVASDNINKVTYGTCLATDMAGFSTIAEKMGPGDLAQFLNEYFEVLAQALKRHHVVVTEFRADAIMCAWTGSPENTSVRHLPVAAALDAATAINLFNSQRNLPGSLRVGLADGNFYVGHAGGGGHFVYSIVGDCANTASRIESLNKHLGTQLLATCSVVEGQNDLLVRYLGKFRFVGKSESLPIAEIVTTKINATESQLDLCARYAPALVAFERGMWMPAIEQLQNLLKIFPQDGPSRFLLERSIENLKPDSTPDELGVIVMKSK